MIVTLADLIEYATRAGLPPQTQIKITGIPWTSIPVGTTIIIRREMLKAVIGDRPTLYIDTSDAKP